MPAYSNAVRNRVCTYCAQNKDLCLFYLFLASCVQSGNKMEASGSFTRTYKFAAVTAFTRGKKRWLRFCGDYTQETGCRHFLLMKEKNETLLYGGLVVNDRYFVFLKIALKS